MAAGIEPKTKTRRNRKPRWAPAGSPARSRKKRKARYGASEAPNSAPSSPSHSAAVLPHATTISVAAAADDLTHRPRVCTGRRQFEYRGGGEAHRAEAEAAADPEAELRSAPQRNLAAGCSPRGPARPRAARARTVDLLGALVPPMAAGPLPTAPLPRPPPPSRRTRAERLGLKCTICPGDLCVGEEVPARTVGRRAGGAKRPRGVSGPWTSQTPAPPKQNATP